MSSYFDRLRVPVDKDRMAGGAVPLTALYVRDSLHSPERGRREGGRGAGAVPPDLQQLRPRPARRPRTRPAWLARLGELLHAVPSAPYPLWGTGTGACTFCATETKSVPQMVRESSRQSARRHADQKGPTDSSGSATVRWSWSSSVAASSKRAGASRTTRLEGQNVSAPGRGLPPASAEGPPIPFRNHAGSDPHSAPTRASPPRHGATPR